MLKKAYVSALRFFEKYYWIIFGAAVLTLAFYCFRCLDVQYVDSWDEARHGVNAYEMIQNGNYIQHTYNYQVDDWNLKPSISYWGIVLGFRLFGYTVFGLRFTSALAYLLTGVAVALFAKRYSREASILVLGFFCANTRPLSAHLARSGDADALYLLFFTLAMLAMFRIREKKKNLYVCGLCFSLAFLTKSWHAGMIAVIGGLYLLASRELFRLKAKEWEFFLLSVSAPLILWFGWRFTADGFTFLKQMVEVDLLARTGSSNFEGHEFPFSFYYETVFGQEAFLYRWLILICILGTAAGAVWLWRRKNWTVGKRQRIEDACGYLLWFFVPFLGFSLIRTKLIWYCYPAIVPLFLAAAIFLGGWLRMPLAGMEAEEGVRPRWQQELQGLCFWALAGLCVFATAYYMRETYYTVIREAHGDPFQMFIQESVDRDSAYAGQKAYIQVPTENPDNLGTWDQNMLFMAEISGDYRCEAGGVEGFLQESEEAVFYLSQAQYEQRKQELADLQVLYQNEGYILLENYH